MIMESSAQPLRETQWTEAQCKAIQRDGRHILVSAGAGTGKTMVLVKRLMERIGDTAEPLDVDRLLVMTFTNAAAAEMKKRLAALLSAELGKNPSSSHIRRQLLLLNKARISTVHSFCLEVIREHYHRIGLDPSFRLMDEEESLLLQQDLLEELLEDYYAEHELHSPFYRLAESRSSVRGDRPLQDLIIKLYYFAWSHPDPERWLEKKVAAFAGDDAEAFQYWLGILQEDCRQDLKKMIDLLLLAWETSGQPGGPVPYRENLADELALTQKALDASYGSWEDLSCAVQEISFASLKPCRGDGFDPALQKRATELRNRCKKELARLREQLFSRSPKEQEAELHRITPMLQVLVQIVCDFHKRYQALKLERGMADFNDLEHYALQILRHPNSPAGRPLPSAAALSYREHFAAVLVDEYQDINQLQEAIITLVSRDEPGNMFMVGDVKQSIYRFRLAEPELFINKTSLFKSSNLNKNGETISLTHNFRSRMEIIDGVNYLFRQIMDEKVGEITYDEDAALRGAAFFPPLAETGGQYGLELLLLTHADPYQPAGEESGADAEPAAENQDEPAEEKFDAAADGDPMLADEEWDAAALEGKVIARRIREMRGEQSGEPLLIYDKKTDTYRPPAYRDIVILLRSNRNYAPAILEELQRSGIPAYAELSTGYFAATEVEVMLSLLQVIDNPYQDIPLAAVLRSPLMGLRGEQLARLRIATAKVPFYEAIKTFLAAAGGEEAELRPLWEKLQSFMDQLYRWQETARQESLGSLIWEIYTDSGYYDLVGGMPGGRQRQANLRALHDRAKQYEATSFRGLSRFLSFVQRLRERGSDLGTARALGEQEDVVRLLTVHKSKGLEFPVVFVAGLARQFNMQDLGRDFLLHKELGFGPKYHDMELRLIYPTLPWLAVKRRLQLELLAEEMRILYVALTRAGQKLVLMAALRDIGAKVRSWEEQARQQNLLLPVSERMQARSVMEWLGPALLRHPQAGLLRKMARQPERIKIFSDSEKPSDWKVEIFTAASLRGAQAGVADVAAASTAEQLAGLKDLKPVPVLAIWEKEIARRLGWRYAYPAATRSFAKLSVTTLQRLQTSGFDGQDGDKPLWLAAEFPAESARPRLLETGPPAAVRGTAYHLVMRFLDLRQPLDKAGITQQLAEMVERQQLTLQEREMVDPGLVSAFFQEPLGQRLLAAQPVWRELPFTMTMPATQLYTDWQGEEEQVFIQGVIDCLFREEGGLVLVDYKFSESGDAVLMQARYGRQIHYYAHAVAQIRGEPVKETYLYLINRQKTIKIEIAPGS
ncbi:MAG TPA: helicase-exonuclease AddAB subunit AddA [Firmicutes bacterium]|nr:helicase-exonuclease AddAB subunit AddA [Bacillota bacterium]